MCRCWSFQGELTVGGHCLTSRAVQPGGQLAVANLVTQSTISIHDACVSPNTTAAVILHDSDATAAVMLMPPILLSRLLTVVQAIRVDPSPGPPTPGTVQAQLSASSAVMSTTFFTCGAGLARKLLFGYNSKCYLIQLALYSRVV
jgi:hypothetical protein